MLLPLLVLVAITTSLTTHASSTSFTSRVGFLTSTSSTQFVWKRLNDLPQARSDHTITYVDRTTSYIAGGCMTDYHAEADGYAYGCQVARTLWAYDAERDEYASMPDLPTPRLRHGAGFLGGKLYLFGGVKYSFNGTDLLAAKMDVFDSVTETWTSHDDTMFANITDMTAFQIDNVLYAAGGYDVPAGYLSLSQVYKFIPATLTWIKVADLTQNRGDAHATVVRAKAYIVGGWTMDDFFNAPLGSVEVFDPQSNAVTLLSDELEVPGGDKAICSLNDKIFAFGGETHDAVFGGSLPQDEVEVLSVSFNSPEYNDWHYSGQLPTKRFRFSCVSSFDTSLLGGSSIRLFGGQEGILNGDPFSKGSYFPISKRVDALVELRFGDLTDRTTHLRLSGTYNVGRLMSLALDTIEERSRSNIRAKYRQVQTVVAQREFVGNVNDSNVPLDDGYIGDSPLDMEFYNTIAQNGHFVIHVPLFMTPVRVVYNLQNRLQGENVVLDSCTLVGIFSKKITTWDATEFGNIVTSNSFLSRYAGIPIIPFRQSNESSQTTTFVAFAKKACASRFDADAFYSLPVVTARAPPTGVVGSISYAYISHFTPGAIYTEARLKNRRGTVLSVSDASFVNLANDKLPLIDAGAATQDFGVLRDSFVDGDFVLAWPIVSMTFAYVRRDHTLVAQTGPLLVSLLRFLVSAEGQSFATNSGLHVALPAPWLAYSAKAIAEIKVAADSIAFVLDDPNGESDYSLASSRRGRLDFELREVSAVLNRHENSVNNLLSAATIPPTTNAPPAQNNSIAIAGLVIACFGFLLASYAAIKVSRLQKANNANTIDGVGSTPQHKPQIATRTFDKIEVV